jgi:hypothetical protein
MQCAAERYIGVLKRHARSGFSIPRYEKSSDLRVPPVYTLSGISIHGIEQNGRPDGPSPQRTVWQHMEWQRANALQSPYFTAKGAAATKMRWHDFIGRLYQKE